jgi:hypothetical protein
MNFKKRLDKVEEIALSGKTKDLSDMTDEELMYIITRDKGGTLTDEQLYEIVRGRKEYFANNSQ